MLILRNLTRAFHTSMIGLAAEKSALASLRKKTGYTFSNCKKALELHNNDLGKAEEWLKEQAQALGWSKATKLEGRPTTQGLVGVAVDKNNAVLLEINCETDFVARNAEFQNMVAEATQTCLSHLKNHSGSAAITKFEWTAEQLKELKSNDGKSLSDKLALMIGTVGENAALKRSFGFKAQEDILLAGYAHPSGQALNNVLLGRIGGLIALRCLNEETVITEDVAAGLCQHIVGMAPNTVGNIEEEPAQNKEDETSLVHQEYLLDESITIKDLLEQNELEVVDFKRFECGETTSGITQQSLDSIETCQ